MAAYDTLRAAIDNYIKANGNKEITGTVLNDILNAMVSALGADTRFAGVAVPSTNPGNPEGNVVYFASQAGTYSNFGGIVLPLGIHILVWNGTAWTSQTWFSVDNTPTQNSQNLATSGGILQAIVDAVGVERLRAIGVEVTSCSFDSNTKKISFFNSANSTLFQLDATAFVIDGMVSDVKIEDGNLVIQFNTDAGKQDIEIPLTEIFNPSNYYTKTAIDALLALYYTKTETDALLTAINNKLADGCLYRGMAEPTTNPSTPTTKVFYIATKAGTYTNFGNIAVTEGITILKYDGSNWSKEQISYSDGVFDISAYNGTSYADLSAALGTNGANVPEGLRKGGMSVKFVQSSDNKYIQYRYMLPYDNTTAGNNAFNNVDNWQGVGCKDDNRGNNLSQNKKLHNKTLIGKGATVVQAPVETLIPGNDYIIYFKNPNWNASEIETANWYIFEVLSYDSLRTPTRLVGYKKSDYGNIPKAAQIHIPSDSESVTVFARANTDIEIDLCFVDISYAKSTFNSVLGLIAYKDYSGVTTETISSLIANKTYVLRITSPTGVSWNGAESDVAWIEVYYNDGTFTRVLQLRKTDTFNETVVTFAPSANCNLNINPCRIHDNEILRIELFDAEVYNYTITSFPQVLSASQKQQVVDNLGLDSRYDSVGLLEKKNYSGITTGEIYNLTANKTYVVVVTSPTGVTFAGVESDTAWIEVWYNDGTFTRVYALSKTDSFKEKAIRFTPITDCTLKANPIRIQNNEVLTIELFDAEIYDMVVRPYPQDFTDRQKAFIIESLGLNQPAITKYNEENIEFVKTAQTKLHSYGQYGFNKYPSILILTDSHGDWTRINRGLYLGEEDVFSSILHLGDIVDGSGQFNNVSWESLVLGSSKPVLAIPGNHEYEYVANNPIYVGLTDAETRSILYSNGIISHNGEIHPTINNEVKNYYYKDIEKNGYKLRLIALYQFEWNSPVDGEGHPVYGDGVGKDVALYSQEQIDWLVNILQNTTSDYSVIIMSHMALTKFKYSDNEFVENNSRNTVISDSNMFARLSNKHFFYSIIDAFVNGGQCVVSSDQRTPDSENHPISVNASFTGGGKFVCNLCGHTHDGGNGYMLDSNNDDLTNYRVIVCPATSCADKQNTGWIGRAEEGKIQDCLDSITYNFDLDKIYLVRFGSTINSNLKEIKSLVL